MVNKIEGVIKSLDIEAQTSSRAVWHPDGRAFAANTATKDIQIVSTNGELQRKFEGGHMGDITALAWSPNGALLLTAGMDKKIILWETQTQKIIARYLRFGYSRSRLTNPDTIFQTSSIWFGTPV